MATSEPDSTLMVFGKSDDKRTKIANFITGTQDINSGTKHCVAASAEWRGKPLTVVKTPDLFSLSVEAVREEMKRCVSLCSPGPNVLLLLVKPSDFTENDTEKLKFILSLFGPDAFKHSIVVLTHDEKRNKCVDELICDCEERLYNMFEQNHNLLMENIETIVNKNNESFVTLSKQKKPSLNLVLCGRRGAGKTSAVESILGRTERPAASSPGQCVKHQGWVCGRWVSLVELPALSGKPLEAVMQQCLSCISLCGPEGVHAFILVLPVAPLTDEDKAELKTIQDTFSSRVHPFTMILFTVDSTLSVDDFIEKDNNLQELCQSCGGGSLIFNTRGQQQVSELLESVERLKAQNKPHSYTTETLVQAQIEKICAQHKELQDPNSKSKAICDEQTPDCLRIVLIGKTGIGKSSSGNTILGRKTFEATISSASVTQSCKKEKTEVDGRPVAVVDTPGLFDTSLSNDQVIDEMSKCINLLAPGPHVFLLVIQIGPFTNEEKETLTLIQRGFGKKAKKYTMILLTHGDKLKNENVLIENYIDRSDSSLKKFISDCGNRYHVFDNCDKENRTQVKDLIKKIDDLVKENGGGCYTNDMLQEAEAAIKKEMERILKEKEEEMRREREEMERKYQQEMEEIEKQKQHREKELKEKEQMIKEEQELRKKEQEKREEEDRKRKEQEEIQHREWEKIYKDLEEKIKLGEESKETIDRKLQESRRQMEEEREQREKERIERWEKYKVEDERKQQEFKQELKKFNKRLEEDRIRQKQEEKDLEERHKKEVEKLKRTYEENARKQAEEINTLRQQGLLKCAIF